MSRKRIADAARALGCRAIDDRLGSGAGAGRQRQDDVAGAALPAAARAVDAPERILALTFTRRAAEEMRERVIAALEAGALAECPAGLQRADLGARVARAPPSARARHRPRAPSFASADRDHRFVQCLAGHTTAHHVRGRRPAHAHRQPEAALRGSRAPRAAARSGTTRFGTAVERVLAVGDQRWRPLVDADRRDAAERDRWLPLLAGTCMRPAKCARRGAARAGADAFRRGSRTAGDARAQGALDVLGGELLASAAGPACAPPQAAGRGTAGALGLAARIPLRSPRTPPTLARWRSVAELLLTKEGQASQAASTRSRGFRRPARRRQPMHDLLGRTRAPIRGASHALVRDPRSAGPALRRSDWERVRDVAQVLVLAAAELDGVFREQGAVDFPAVSMAALRALGTPTDAPTDLSLRLDYRLQHLLLDEFQDTSARSSSWCAAHGGLAARRRAQRLLRRRSDAVDLWLPPSGGAGVSRPGGERTRRRAVRCAAAERAISARTRRW